MNFARQLREFFIAMFGPRGRTLYVELLKERLAKAEQTADYFRARAERLELMLLPDRQAKIARAPIDPRPVGRKTWADVQRENAEKIQHEVEAEAQTKAAKEQGAN